MRKKVVDNFKIFENSYQQDLKEIKNIINYKKYKEDCLEKDYARLCNFLFKRNYYAYVPLEYVDSDIRTFLRLCHVIWIKMFEYPDEISFCDKPSNPMIIFKKQKDITLEDYFHESECSYIFYKMSRHLILKEEIEMKFFKNAKEFMDSIIKLEREEKYI